MRVYKQLWASHVPLIKFVGGPHTFKGTLSAAVKPHPCAPGNIVPGALSTETPSLFTSRSQLSKRFRYSLVDDLEIEEVNTGGAEIVF